MQKKQDLDKFKRRLIRSISQHIKDSTPEDEMWKIMKENTGCDCKLLWERMRALTLKKLSRLLPVGDHVKKVSKVARMNATDWLMYDLVLVHEDIDVISCENDDIEAAQPLLELIGLVSHFKIEKIEAGATEELSMAWMQVTTNYNNCDRRCSPMLLQKRWFQVKKQTREFFYYFWFKFHKSLQNASEKPKPIYVAVAKRFPNLITSKFLEWTDLVKEKLIVSPEDFEMATRGPPEINSKQDLVVLEPHIETIDLGQESDEENVTSSTASDTNKTVIKEEVITCNTDDEFQEEVDESDISSRIIEAENECIMQIDDDSPEVDNGNLGDHTDDNKVSLTTQSSYETENELSKTVDVDNSLNPETDILKAIDVDSAEEDNITNDEDKTLLQMQNKNKFVPIEDEKDNVITINDDCDMECDELNKDNVPKIKIPISVETNTILDPHSMQLNIDDGLNNKMDVEETHIKKEIDYDLLNKSSNNINKELLPSSTRKSDVGLEIKDFNEDVYMSDNPVHQNESNNNHSNIFHTFFTCKSEFKSHVPVSPPISISCTEKSQILTESNENQPVKTQDLPEPDISNTFITFIDDGIEYIDDGVEFPDHIPDGSTKKGNTEDNEIRNTQQSCEDLEQQNFDYKLLLTPVVYTTRLEDMITIVDKKINSLNIKDIIFQIIEESKPAIKAKPAMKVIKEENTPIAAEEDGDSHDNENDENSDNIPNEKRFTLSHPLLLKPKKRIYNPIVVCKNPDFNTRLKRLPATFLTHTRNIALLKSCKPLTIDLHKCFEKNLINGILYLKKVDNKQEVGIKDNNLTNQSESATATVAPSAMPAQSLFDNVTVNFHELVPQTSKIKKTVIESHTIVNLVNHPPIRSDLQTSKIKENLIDSHTIANLTNVKDNNINLVNSQPVSSDNQTSKTKENVIESHININDLTISRDIKVEQSNLINRPPVSSINQTIKIEEDVIESHTNVNDYITISRDNNTEQSNSVNHPLVSFNTQINKIKEDAIESHTTEHNYCTISQNDNTEQSNLVIHPSVCSDNQNAKVGNESIIQDLEEYVNDIVEPVNQQPLISESVCVKNITSVESNNIGTSNNGINETHFVSNKNDSRNIDNMPKSGEKQIKRRKIPIQTPWNRRFYNTPVCMYPDSFLTLDTLNKMLGVFSKSLGGIPLIPPPPLIDNSYSKTVTTTPEKENVELTKGKNYNVVKNDKEAKNSKEAKSGNEKIASKFVKVKVINNEVPSVIKKRRQRRKYCCWLNRIIQSAKDHSLGILKRCYTQHPCLDGHCTCCCKGLYSQNSDQSSKVNIDNVDTVVNDTQESDIAIMSITPTHNLQNDPPSSLPAAVQLSAENTGNNECIILSDEESVTVEKEQNNKTEYTICGFMFQLQDGKISIDSTSNRSLINHSTILNKERKYSFVFRPRSNNRAPMKLGINKILLTSYKFKDQNTDNVQLKQLSTETHPPLLYTTPDQCNSLPNGVQLILLPTGEISAMLEKPLSEEMMAHVANIVTAAQKQMSISNVNTVSHSSGCDKIDLTNESETDILDTVRKNELSSNNKDEQKRTEKMSSRIVTDGKDIPTEHSDNNESEDSNNKEIQNNIINENKDTQSTEGDNKTEIPSAYKESPSKKCEDTDNVTNESKKSILSDLMEMSGISTEDTIVSSVIADDTVLSESLGNIISNTESQKVANPIVELTPVTNLAEIKLSAENGGKFYTLNINTGKIFAVHIDIKKKVKPYTNDTIIEIDDDSENEIVSNQKSRQPEYLLKNILNKKKMLNNVASIVRKKVVLNGHPIKTQQDIRKKIVKDFYTIVNLEDHDNPMIEEYLETDSDSDQVKQQNRKQKIVCRQNFDDSSDDEPLAKKVKRKETPILPKILPKNDDNCENEQNNENERNKNVDCEPAAPDSPLTVDFQDSESILGL